MIPLTDNQMNITFCIVTFNKTPWVKRCLSSIQRYCETEHSVKIVSQGQSGNELMEFLRGLNDDRFELITSSVNIGASGARKLLAGKVTSPLMMMLDDDMYLTAGSVTAALDVLQKNPTVGAVSMPQYDLRGRPVARGGMRIDIRGGVIHRIPVILDSSPWIEVEYLGGGATMFRTEMRDCFSWDEEYRTGFEDLDNCLQILRARKWKQAIACRGRLIHDRSWVGKNPRYERSRFNGFRLRRNYRYFRKKWGLRLDMKSHILTELVYPVVEFAHFPFTVSQIDSLSRRRGK